MGKGDEKVGNAPSSKQNSGIFTGECFTTSRIKSFTILKESERKGRKKSTQIHFDESVYLKKRKKTLAQNLNYN